MSQLNDRSFRTPGVRAAITVLALAGGALLWAMPGAAARATAGRVCSKGGATTTDATGRRLECVARGKQRRWELRTGAVRPTTTSASIAATITTLAAIVPASAPKPATTLAAPNPAPPTVAATPSGTRCVLFLHGKGGKGYGVRERNGFTDIGPTGNADAPKEWGGNFQWLYAEESDYRVALTILQKAVEGPGCGQIVLAGASNGGAMAAKVYCRGESFGGRLVGALFDDPVPDQVIDGCKPAKGVQLALVQSDWMDGVVQGGKACPSGWTCQGNVYSLADYAKALGVAKPGRTKEHSSAGDLTPYIMGWWK